jgi:site-specific DNA-methyltransferase (adenine-specific)
MEESPIQDANKWNSGGIGERRREAGLGFARNIHPTVKPIRLMTWIVRLITPPGGRLFAPFVGSGTDLLAGEAVGVTVEGCELEPAYCDIARARFLGQVKEAGVTHG